MAGLPKVTINVTGGITRPAANEDGISGYVFYNDNIGDLTTFTSTNRIVKFTNLPAVEATGITSSSTNFKEEHYQIKEHFRAGGAELYIGIFEVPAVSYDFTEISTMHLFSSGDIRLYGIYASKNDLTSSDLGLINTLLEAFDSTKQPAVAFYAANTGTIAFDDFADLKSLATDLPFVSSVIGQDTENDPLVLSVTNSVPNLGIVVGTASQAKVNENILNVGVYNYSDTTNMVVPGFFISGSTENELVPITDYTATNLDDLIDKGYIFWRYFPNVSGTYLSNDVNCVAPTETFNSVHIMRTRNKVIRLADAAMTPFIGSTLLVNSNGTLKNASITALSNALATPMNEMKNTDVEISDFDIYINPDQDFISTKTVEVELSILPTESADYITVNVSFVSTL